MAGDDENNDDDTSATVDGDDQRMNSINGTGNAPSTTAGSGSNMASPLQQLGLPVNVVDVLRRMAPHEDRLTWTVVENARMVSLALQWDMQQKRRGNCSAERVQSDSTSGGTSAATTATASASSSAAMAKDSLWHRIRKSLQSRRRTLSVNGLSAVVTAAVQAERRKADGSAAHQHADALVSSSQSHEVTSGRCSARAAREMWRKSVERGRAAASGSAGHGWSRDVSWSPPVARSAQHSADNEYWWTCADLNLSSEQYGGEADVGHDVANRRLTHQQIRRLQPSLSLPEKFATTVPAVAPAAGSSIPWQNEPDSNGVGYTESGGHSVQKRAPGARSRSIEDNRLPLSRDTSRHSPAVTCVTRQHYGQQTHQQQQQHQQQPTVASSKRSSWPRLSRSTTISAATALQQRQHPASIDIRLTHPSTEQLSPAALIAEADAIHTVGRLSVEWDRRAPGGSSSADSLVDGLAGGCGPSSVMIRAGSSSRRRAEDGYWNDTVRDNEYPMRFAERRRSSSSGPRCAANSAAAVWSEGNSYGSGSFSANCTRTTPITDRRAPSRPIGLNCVQVVRQQPTASSSSSAQLSWNHPEAEGCSSCAPPAVELPPVDYRTVMHCLDSCDKILFRHSTTIK